MATGSGYGSAGVGFMDGDYLPVSDMRLPVTDMGFQLGDMCYDAIHVHKGSFFRLPDHLDRWEHSIRRAALRLPRGTPAPRSPRFSTVVSPAPICKDSMVTFAATRGSPTTAHKDLRTCKNRFMVWALAVLHGPVARPKRTPVVTSSLPRPSAFRPRPSIPA